MEIPRSACLTQLLSSARCKAVGALPSSGRPGDRSICLGLDWLHLTEQRWDAEGCGCKQAGSLAPSPRTASRSPERRHAACPGWVQTAAFKPRVARSSQRARILLPAPGACGRRSAELSAAWVLPPAPRQQAGLQRARRRAFKSLLALSAPAAASARSKLHRRVWKTGSQRGPRPKHDTAPSPERPLTAGRDEGRS